MLKKPLQKSLSLVLSCAMASSLLLPAAGVEADTPIPPGSAQAVETNVPVPPATASEDNEVMPLAASEPVELTLNVGDSITYHPWTTTGEVTTQPDSAVASYTITQDTTPSFTMTGAQGIQTNTSTAFPLSDALYQFQKVSSYNYYNITHRNADGSLLYLNFATQYYPTSKDQGSSIQVFDSSGKTYLYSNSCYLSMQLYNSNYYWYIHNGYYSTFTLFRPAKPGEAASTELPGYVALSGASEIEDGGFYLITVLKDGAYYVLYPQTSGTYTQMLKADSSLSEVSGTYYSVPDPYTLTITAKGVGSTELVVDGQTYQITVTDISHLKTQLSEAITEAEKIVSRGYSAHSWNIFQLALSSAKDTLANDSSTFKELQAALDALSDAQDALYCYLIPEGGTEYTGGAPAGGAVPDNDGISGNTSNPFPSGLAGSQYFRIPALITLRHQTDTSKNGRVVAAIDARWNHTMDGCALDTILSYSDNNGVNWNYLFATYLDDSTNQKDLKAASIIDPVMVEGLDGTIYLMADVYPGGIAINTAPVKPDAASGYIEINGVKRLVLYLETNDGVSGGKSNQTDSSYAYYVGDFENGYAPVYSKDSNDTKVYYYIDEWYDLYTAEKEPMYCLRLGTENEYVQQNVFYFNAELHVRNATYLCIFRSTDGGETWSAPQMVNDQVKTDSQMFYGVGPGAGLCLEDGTIVLPTYTYSTQLACFIYSSDNGKTWKRSENATSGAHWSSESFLVQIDSTTLRHFYRDGYATLYYTDHTWDGTAWKAGTPVDTGVTVTYNCQLSGIKYSQKIDEKDAFLISTGASGSASRTYGRIYTFLLNEDKTMELAYTYDVTAPGVPYTYSSISELANGDLALLYESTSNAAAVTYVTYPLAVLQGKLMQVEVSQYDTVTAEFDFVPTESERNEISSNPYVKVSVLSSDTDSSTLSFTGLKPGSTSLTLGGMTVQVTIYDLVTSMVTEDTLEVGDTATYSPTTGTLTLEPDSSVATAALTTKYPTFTVLGGQGNLATDNTYSAGTAPLSNALYQFNGSYDDGFTVVHYNEDGSAVYLNHTVNGAGYPNAATSGSSKIMLYSAGSSQFYLYTSGSYLYFHRDTTKIRFDRNSKTADACKFMLYRPVKEGETSSDEIPGYIRVSGVSDGGYYLIVAYNSADGKYYALYPSTSTSDQYAHCIQVDATAENVTGTVYCPVSYQLTVTAQGAGSTYFAVGSEIYHITVSEPEPAPDPDEDEDVTQTFKVRFHVYPVDESAQAITVEKQSGETLTASEVPDFILYEGAVRHVWRPVSFTEDGKDFNFVGNDAVDFTNGVVVTRDLDYMQYSYFTVTFDPNGGTLTGESSVVVGQMDVLAKPSDPVRSGYTFKGWYQDQTCTEAWDFSDIYNHANGRSSCTLYAGWAAISSGSSGSSSSNSKKEDTTGNKGGSTTTTETVTNKDGSTTTTATETVTNKDGSTTTNTVETVKDAGGNETTTTTEITEKVDKDGTKNTSKVETVKDADGKETVTTTKTKETVQEDGSKKIESTEVIVDHEGNETTTVTNATEKTEVAEDGTKNTTTNAVAVTTDADGKETTKTIATEKTELVNGTTATTVTTSVDGEKSTVEANVNLSEQAIEEAIQAAVDASNGELKAEHVVPNITLPIVQENAKSIDKIDVMIPETVTKEVKVEVPVADATPGTVLVLVHEDGTEEIVKWTSQTENGVSMTLSEGVTLKVKNNAKTFNEDSFESWAKDAVDFMSSRELMLGDGNGNFGMADMSRGDLALMLYRLQGEPETESKDGFQDVGEQAYYGDAVNWISEAGFMNGYGDGKFGASDSITREQLITILYRIADKPETSGSTAGFKDGELTSEFATNAMQWAVETGIMQGNEDGYVMPTETATRTQGAIMLMRFINL